MMAQDSSSGAIAACRYRYSTEHVELLGMSLSEGLLTSAGEPRDKKSGQSELLLVILALLQPSYCKCLLARTFCESMPSTKSRW